MLTAGFVALFNPVTASAQALQSKFAEVNGVRLHYLVAGKGDPVVLLHGYGSNAEDWEAFTGTVAMPHGTRFVFPEAPETTVPPDGPIGGRAWWRLDQF